MMRKIQLVLLASVFLSACSLPDKPFRATAYGEIARARMAAGDAAGARAAAELAGAAALELDGSGGALFTILAAAVAQVRAADPEGARRRVSAIAKDSDRIIVLVGLTLAYKDSGYDSEAIREALEASRLAAAMTGESDADDLLAMSFWARAVSGNVGAAIDGIKKIENRESRDGALALIAQMQARNGDFKGARSTASMIENGAAAAEHEILLSGYIVSGVSIDSLAAFEALLFDSRTPIGTVVYKRIAADYARTRSVVAEIHGARAIFRQAAEHAANSESDGARARGYASIALAQAAGGDFEGAEAPLTWAEALIGQPPGEDSRELDKAAIYVTAVSDAIRGGNSAEGNAGNPESVDEYVELMVLRGLAQIQLGRLDAAKISLNTADRAAPEDDDLRSLVAAAYAFLSAKQTDPAASRESAHLALRAAERLSENTEDRVIGLFFAAVALARAGETGKAMEAAGRIKLEKPKPAQ